MVCGNVCSSSWPIQQNSNWKMKSATSTLSLSWRLLFDFSRIAEEKISSQNYRNYFPTTLSQKRTEALLRQIAISARIYIGWSRLECSCNSSEFSSVE